MPSPPGANLLTGLGLAEVFTRTDVTGTRAVLPDALGSTLALSDPTGALTVEYTYEPFRGTAVTGAPGTNPFQYAGRENDGTGLYYYRARYDRSDCSAFCRKTRSSSPAGPEPVRLRAQ